MTQGTEQNLIMKKSLLTHKEQKRRIAETFTFTPTLITHTHTNASDKQTTHTSMSVKGSTDRRIDMKRKSDAERDSCLEKLPLAEDQASVLCVML